MDPSRKTLLMLLLPLAAGLASAWPVLDNGFTFDDEVLIVNNPYVHDFSHLGQNLTRDHFYSKSTPKRGMGYYRPLVKLLFMVQYQLFGPAPRGYHAVSLALFLLCAAAAFLLFCRLGVRPDVAAAGAAVFAANPCQAESVALVASQADLLSVLFILGALYGHVRWRQGGTRAWLAVALTLGVLALASKETGVLLVLLVPLYDLGHDGLSWRTLRRSLGPALGFLALVVAYGALRLALGITPIHQSMNTSALQSVAASAKIADAVMLRALVPPLWVQTAQNARPAGSAGALLLWLLPALAAAAAAALAIRRPPRWRWGALLLVVPVLPVLPNSLIHTSTLAEQLYVSDRWALLPAVGAGLLWAALAHALGQRAGRLERVAFWGVCGTLAVLWSLNARLENASYRDETTRMLWEAAALRDKAKLSPPERQQLLAVDALAATRRGDHAAAASLYRQMARLRPDDHTVRFNLALMLMKTGAMDEALHNAWLAVHSVSPDRKVRLPRSDAFFRHRVDKVFLLGLILEKKGQRAEAMKYFHWCLKMNPAHPGALRKIKNKK